MFRHRRCGGGFVEPSGLTVTQISGAIGQQQGWQGTLKGNGTAHANKQAMAIIDLCSRLLPVADGRGVWNVSPPFGF